VILRKVEEAIGSLGDNEKCTDLAELVGYICKKEKKKFQERLNAFLDDKALWVLISYMCVQYICTYIYIYIYIYIYNIYSIYIYIHIY
jgi:hypothetical protein